MKKIILVGYMGSGKSTIGEKLANLIDCEFVDLDIYIEKNQKKSIKSIFETKGEIFFRKIEHQLLIELLEKKEKIILSVGGGTPCFKNNSDLLFTKNYTTIFLKASIDELYNRLSTEKDSRPIIAHLDSENLKEFIAKHLFERNVFYSQSTYTVSVDKKTPQEIVEEIISLLF